MKKLLMLGMISTFCLANTIVANAADNGTEFGVEDDIWVGGTGGTAADPDAEIKGFTVFGSTQASYSPNIPIGPGNVIVNGYLGVSSGAYFVGGSTFAAQGAYFLGVSSFSDVSKVYIGGTGAANNKALLYDGTTGSLKWGDVSSLVSGDNLGNHIATMTLNMSNFNISNVNQITASSITITNANGIMSSGQITASSFTATNALGVTSARYQMGSNIVVSSAAAAQYGGVHVSTHIFVNGKIYGDGSGLTGISGDNLGNHVATTTLNMSNFNISNVNQITASSITITNANGIMSSGQITASSFTATNALGVTSARYQMGSNIVVSSAAAAQYGGVHVSTHIFVNGKIYGDGSGLTGISGDNLGNHIATTTLNMSNFNISNANHITASSATYTNDLIVNGSASLGDGTASDIVTINGSNTAGVKFAVFRSGGSDVAWMRKK